MDEDPIVPNSSGVSLSREDFAEQNPEDGRPYIHRILFQTPPKGMETTVVGGARCCERSACGTKADQRDWDHELVKSHFPLFPTLCWFETSPNGGPGSIIRLEKADS